VLSDRELACWFYSRRYTETLEQAEQHVRDNRKGVLFLLSLPEMQHPSDRAWPKEWGSLGLNEQ